MKNLLNLLTLFLLSAAANHLSAQIELKIQLQPGTGTYTVFARSQADVLPPFDNFAHSAQVTVVVPTGSFEVDSLQNHAGQWQLTQLVQHPIENPGVDYAIFNLTAPTDAITFLAGQEVPLFSLENKNGCTGALEIMHPVTDPFLPPNSLNIPAGNEFSIGTAPIDAYLGNYDAGSADCFRLSNCLITFELELLPDNFYQISLHPDGAFQPTSTVEMLQVAVKVPTGFFQIHDLTNLLPGTFSFGNVSRNDGPPEDENADYIQFRMNASGQGLTLQPGAKIPLLQFANGGSCQGDSIFLVKNDDPFLPPNAQGAGIGSVVKFTGNPAAVPVCAGSSAAAPCMNCLFTDGILKIDSIQSANPVACLGGANGMLRIFAHGANSLEYSIDGGQNWSPDSYFGGLPAGIFGPVVRGTKYGCPVTEAADQPLELTPATAIDLQIEVPTAACEGSEVPFKIMSPNPLPANASFAWSGPQGFNATIPDPVIFNVNNYQSGNYTLTVNAAGCDPATASANLEVHALPAVPDILSNGPVCFGEKLRIYTAATGQKFEWHSPLGFSAATLALPGLTTTGGETFIEPAHPAYLSGNWQVQITDPNGCTATSAPLAVSIKPRPQAFAENTGAVCPGGQAQLLGNPLPGAVYEWKKQGDTTVFSMQPNPAVSNVLAPQTFQLMVTQDGCTSLLPAFTTISLNPQPAISADHDYDQATDCSPQNLQLMAISDGVGLSYSWSGPGGFASQAASPLIPAATAAANGSYVVEATNPFGCTTSQVEVVTEVVDPLPVPQVQSTGPACPGEAVQLSVQAYTGSQVSYQWFKNNLPMGGQVSNLLNFSAIQTSNEGNYRVRVQVDGCTVESVSLPLDVLDNPQAVPDFSLSQPCEGGTLQFFANLSGITSWHWSGPGGFASDSPNPLIYNVKFDEIGAYTLTVTGSNGCSATASLIVDGILPVPDAPLVTSNSPVCPEDSIVLTVQNPALLGSVQYVWMNGASEYIGTGQATLTLAVGDPQAVPPFLVQTIVNTCPSDLSNPVTVETLPPPVALAWSGGPVCEGETAQLFAATVPNGSYQWRIAGQSQVVSIEQNPLLPLSDSTDFQLVVQSNGCATEATASVSVPVNPAPVIADIAGGGAFCEGSSVSLSASNAVPLANPVQFTWTGPGGFTFSGTAVPTGPFPLGFSAVSPQNEGAYTLTLQSAEGCTSAPQSVAVEVGEMPQPPVLAVADAVLCPGETLQLDATPTTGSSVAYHWFFNDGTTDFPLAVTSYPTYFLPSVTSSNSGSYFVKTVTDGCEPPASNLVPVTVLGAPQNLLATNPTTSLTPACEGSVVPLEATLLPGADYHWYGPAGFFSDLPNPLLDGVEVLQAGSYLVVIGLPQCSVTWVASTDVFVQPAPATPVLTGTSEACEGTDVTISVTNAEAGAAYDFYFGQNIQPFSSGGGASVILENVGSANSGGYFASASLNGCESAVSSSFLLEIIPVQTGIAFAGDDRTVCEENEIVPLQATPPAVGSGLWTSLDGATVVQPDLAHSTSLGLLPGPNRFVWTLTNGICPGAGSDTAVVFLEKIGAAGDYFSVSPNDTLLNINLLDNDSTQFAPAWDFAILKRPRNGQLLDDSGSGTVTYIPYPNAFGEDGFSYRICSMTCPDVCAEASVRIDLSGSTDPADCFLPNLITPDGDGLDETFTVPCAATWPGSRLTVFNRWGAVVFESKNYENDWGGTYHGEPLPTGTYFYHLTLNDGKRTLLQGFVVVDW
ncbi:MAG: gliding motility-associated C-terminal domain-containing protein [Bacteroidetes bacterium]|nr:gliding motility-associated C-terminal domain-containing protein [Bacteroidota bacterium]